MMSIRIARPGGTRVRRGRRGSEVGQFGYRSLLGGGTELLSTLGEESLLLSKELRLRQTR